MENIEQLKLENEKLNARLNKAAEVFRTQKTQIEKLNIQLVELDNMILEYKDQINVLEKSLEQAKIQENNISVKDSEDYIKVFNENNSLKNRLNEVENVAVSLDNLKENHIKEIHELNETIKKCDEEINNLDNLLNEERTNNDELNEKFKTLNEKYKALYETYNKTKNLHDDNLKRYNELEDNYKNLQNIHNKNLLEIEASHTNIAKLQKDHDDAVKTAAAYQKSYKEVKDQNAVLQEKLDKITEEVQALEKERNNHNRIISEMESLKTGSEEVINNLSQELESKNIELSKYKNKQQKYEEFVTTIFDISDSFRNNGNNIEEIKQPDNPPLKSKIPVKPNSTNNPFMSDAVGMNI